MAPGLRDSEQKTTKGRTETDKCTYNHSDNYKHFDRRSQMFLCCLKDSFSEAFGGTSPNLEKDGPVKEKPKFQKKKRNCRCVLLQ